MTVHIITPNQENDEMIEDIIGMFEKDNGPLDFYHISSSRCENLNLNENEGEISLNQFQRLASSIRDYFRLPIRDYMVLVTPKSMESPNKILKTHKEWISYYYNQNILVKSTGWEEITEDRPYLAVAHQIIENLFQQMGNIDLTSVNLDESIHMETDVCINDFCENLNDTKGKIRSGYICKSCIEAAKEVAPTDLILQIKKILSRISDRARDNFNFSLTKEEQEIEITDEFEVKIGGKIINWGKSKVLHPIYLFYLINHNIKLGESDFRGERVYNDAKEKFVDMVIKMKVRHVFEKIFGTPFYKRLHENELMNVGSYIFNISSYGTRLYNKLLNEVNIDTVGHMYRLQSDKFDNTYKIIVEPDNIKIPESLLKFRVSEA